MVHDIKISLFCVAVRLSMLLFEAVPLNLRCFKLIKSSLSCLVGTPLTVILPTNRLFNFK